MNVTLHERIAHILERHAPPLRHEWIVHSPILHSEGVGVDIRKANRHFRLTLGTLPVKTTEERECLYETQDFEAWLNDFEHYVVPLLVRFKTATHHHR